ncbi:MAG TPA: hypothetical protein VNL74_00015 [Methylococcus sp.]|nr:hypothetical protein [Methylococcus sp.]
MFFTQRELQRATRDQVGLRRLLYQLVPALATRLEGLEAKISSQSGDLRRLVRRAVTAQQELAEAEQRLAASSAARDALERYEQIGAGRLAEFRADISRVETLRRDLEAIIAAIATQLEASNALELHAPATDAMRGLVSENQIDRLAARLDEARGLLRRAADVLSSIASEIQNLLSTAEAESDALRTQLEQAVVESGGTTEELNQFAALNTRAAPYEADGFRAL